MKKLFSFFMTLIFIIIVQSQNVSIGTPTHSYYQVVMYMLQVD